MPHVYLVRHAKSLGRAAWQERDELRPLSKAGRRQAEALPVHFGGVGFERLVSSPFVRCLQTLEPLATSLDVTIEHAEQLVEGASGRAALELVLDLTGAGPVAACTHGDVLLDVLSELRGERVPLSGPLECKKGSTWVLEVEAGAFTGGAYLGPPAVGERST